MVAFWSAVPLLVSLSAHPQWTTQSADQLTMIEPKSGARYRLIPAGSFMMGCVPGDNECGEDEKPRHHVTIERSFFLAETETTNDQYRRCVAARVCLKPAALFDEVRGPNLDGQRRESRNNHPVVYVTWDEASTFCFWTGGRLPTEAEWEYAARAGQDGWKYTAGNTLSHGHANFGKDRCCAGQVSGVDRWMLTSPAASFKPNGFGLYDMTGNAWEWTADWYGSYPKGGNPVYDTAKVERVLRGGSWYTHPAWLRLSDRGGNPPSTSSIDYGFRCARDVSEVE